MRTSFNFVVLFLSIQTVLCAANLGEKVFSSDAFVDAIGVNTHFSYSGGKNDVWDKQYAALGALVHESGMRSIRDNVRQGTKYDRINSLYEKYGIRINAIAFQKNASFEEVVNKLTDQWIETFRKNINPKAVLSFEGPNEYNDTRLQNPQWAQKAVRMQQALFTKVRSCNEYAACEIIAPSVWYRIHDDFTALSKTRIAEFSTRGCTHYYTGGKMPTQFKRHAKFDAGTWCSLDEVIADATAMVPGKPMWVTETGYGYLTDARDGSTPISEVSVGKYLPRLLTEWFRSGVVERIYIYSLVDDAKPYGLVRRNLEKRPAFFAVKHLLSALADPGKPFTPNAFPCTLTGGTADIHSLVLEKRNGETDLLLWQEVPSWNIDTMQELKPKPVRITLTFPRPVSGDIVIPGQKPEPGMPGNAFIEQSKIDVSVPDEILIVRLKR
jgi:hypothetical protein